MPNSPRSPFAEWPTLAVLVGTYTCIAAGFALYSTAPIPAALLLALALTQYSSLQHEVLHGHPFAQQWISEVFVFNAFFVVVPYMRFKDTHLQHHFDPALTDPYDDPESNYVDPAVWHKLPRLQQGLLTFNNTLAGRMLLGPAIGIYSFLKADLAHLRAGRRRVWAAWGLNGLGLIPVAALISWSGMQVWVYALVVYLALSLLRVRTYLEHRAHDAHRARTVVVEDRGLLSLLFLNNNFHVVHHMHPQVAWYELPALYAARKSHFLRRNEGYRYKNYREVFARYFWRAKDPVAHPVWPVNQGQDQDTGS